ncbi:MAG TPA: glycoside hydrolase family 13 protein [Spirochaetota bacterium]|nr:glycoside hydrolase family 13 protein [Spirochaetota bacterium]HOL57072.1 glycoside hydrolase family 13 protein [Spirochaetota bacterium]HPP04660.1 glycoside hydrolase family 13 protein [Spirochaetota bacterium]
MKEFLLSLHSELNKDFVSNPYPLINEEIEIKLRVLKNNEIEKVILRTIIDGTNVNKIMTIDKKTKKFIYYKTHLKITQYFLNYHFIIITKDNIYYYNRKDIYHYPPTEDNDFVILANFKNPDWVCKSVFYQIFVDRFYNGDIFNDVQTNEYQFDGHWTKKLNWGDKPLEYNEGFCLDFYGGDLEGVRQKIDYFKEIGVNAIYLNPIFKAYTNHKYDCIDYFNVDDKFGGNNALISLVNDLHKNKLRIIVDVSINHTGSEHQWFKEAINNKNSKYREFYYFDKNNKPKYWRGVHTLPQLNYNSKELRNIIYEGNDSLIAHYLKEPYNIDGWRFDVGMDTGRNGVDQFSNEIFKKVREVAKNIKSDCYLIAEHWKDNISYLLGDQWDGAMNYFASARPLRCFAGEIDRYIEGIVDNKDLKEKHTGEDFKNQIIQHYSRLPNQIAFLQFNLLDSHDIHRFHNNKNFDFDIYKGIIIMLYMLPGTVNIYYGDEIGLNGHTYSVEGCRYPMEWDKTKWNKNFLDLYKTLSFLKQKEEPLHYGSYKFLYSDKNTVVFARFFNKKGLIGIMSRENANRIIDIPVFLIGGDNTKFKDIFNKKEYYSDEKYLKYDVIKINNTILEFNIEE